MSMLLAQDLLAAGDIYSLEFNSSLHADCTDAADGSVTCAVKVERLRASIVFEVERVADRDESFIGLATNVAISGGTALVLRAIKPDLFFIDDVPESAAKITDMSTMEATEPNLLSFNVFEDGRKHSSGRVVADNFSFEVNSDSLYRVVIFAEEEGLSEEVIFVSD